MANHKGSEGVVKIGENTIAEVTAWSIEEAAEIIEDTELSDSAKTFKAGATSWTGSLDCYWDETDATGQGAMTVGSEVTLNLYPEGDESGDTYYTGSAIITSVRRSAAVNGMVITSIAFQGNGALTETTVT